MDVFKKFISPHTKAEFRNKFFEKKACFVKAALSEKEILEYIPASTFDDFLSEFDLPYPRVELIKGGTTAEPPPNNRGIQDRVKLFDAFREGQSIRIRNLHSFVPGIARMVRELSIGLGSLGNANIYITPGAEQGFDPHFDNHDVFILQVHGSKVWNLYEGYEHEVVLPIEGFFDNRIEYKPSTKKETLTLNRGDVLYIPRGVMHEAKALENGSTHVTFGMEPLTIAQLLRVAITRLEVENVNYRKSFSSSLLLPDIDLPSLKNEVESHLVNLLQDLEVEKAILEASEQMAGKMYLPGGEQLAYIFGQKSYNDAMFIKLRRDVFFRIDSRKNDTINISTRSKKLELDKKESSAFLNLSSYEWVAPKDLGFDDTNQYLQFILDLNEVALIDIR